MMMFVDPLPAAVGCADDTSLALPSDSTLRKGQQRVLDQVHTIKRSKSKHGKSGSPTVSPTSLTLQTSTSSSEFGGFKFSPSKANGTFSRTASTMSGAYSRGINSQRSRSLYTKNTMGRHFSTSGAAEQQVTTSRRSQVPNGLKPSLSDPMLRAAFSPVAGTLPKARGQMAANQQTVTRVTRQSVRSTGNGLQMTSGPTRTVHPFSVTSQTDGKLGSANVSKAEKLQSAVNSATTMSDISLEEAVEYLSSKEESYQRFGANYIQHITYSDMTAKDKVLDLKGIPPLVTLLRSSSAEVCQAAAGALRNLVYKNKPNKLEVQSCEGIAKALQLLKETKCTETKKQITGLLWNLSSEDSLKDELTKTAIPALTENVLVPFNSWTQNTDNNVHPDVFYNATGCLRNLSQQCGRKPMRRCPGLIRSLVSHLRSCAAEENPNEKSVENCTCILHNLTYDLEKECPQNFEKFRIVEEEETTALVGCFSPKSRKAQKTIFQAGSPKKEEEVSGVNLLIERTTIDMYVYMLDESSNTGTQEACCGALQNLTAGKGPGSSAMSKLMVKCDVLDSCADILQHGSPNMQKGALALLHNMARTKDVQDSMVMYLLPFLYKLIPSGPHAMGKSDDSVESFCNLTRTLIVSDPKSSKICINKDVVLSLSNLSEDRDFPKGSKAASVLLYQLWAEKDLQAEMKKLSMDKACFVNDVTKRAVAAKAEDIAMQRNASGTSVKA